MIHTVDCSEGGAVSILYLMAANPEYGPALASRITPLMTGVGPVEAAAATARKLAELAATGQKPDLVISLGSCGSRSRAQGEVVQVSSASYRDMDASPLGFEKGRTPFQDHPVEIPIPQWLPDIPACRLSTGGNVISGAAYDAIDADIVDMETFASLRACHHAGVALIGLRGVSDGRDDLRCYADWADYLHAVDERLAEIIDGLPAMISKKQKSYWTRID